MYLPFLTYKCSILAYCAIGLAYSFSPEVVRLTLPIMPDFASRSAIGSW